MRQAIFTLSLLATLTVQQAQSTAIEVSNVQTYVGGTTTTIAGGGGTDNYNTETQVGSYAVFDMQKDGQDYADLRVTYSGDDGTIGSNVLITQTSNSQGLTDTGTISILLNTSSESGGGGSFQFDWFSSGSFADGVQQAGSSLLTDSILYTTFDIDYFQYVAMNTSQLDYYAFNDTTSLHADFEAAPGMVRAEDSGANSAFDNPTTAAQFMTTGTASHQIEMGKQSDNGNALFMFEFRDPSKVLADKDFSPVPVSVPEPSSVALSALTLIAALGVRRIFLI